MDRSKKTMLYDTHIKHGGKMIDFAGWQLPVQYEGIIPEHEAVRNHAGLFDVSHMGEIRVTGKVAFDFIQYLITNDISKLEDNQVLYTMMCYDNGGVVDDLLVYKFNDEHFFLVVNASNVEKDFRWIQQHARDFDVVIENLSSDMGEVALQGPKAEEILQSLTDTDLSTIKFFYFHPQVKISGVDCLVSRTGYTGEDGFEIYTKQRKIIKIWDALLKVGTEKGLKPAGLGARDTLRFEATLPLYGNEINADITPLEAGLGYFVKLDKEKFIGKEALAGQKAGGPKRKIVGFEMEKGVPRHGYEVYKGDKQIGTVTTGYFSPTLKKNIGLALIHSEHAQMDHDIQIKVRKKLKAAKIISKRFLKKNYKK